jgi:hypothetical protein
MPTCDCGCDCGHGCSACLAGCTSCVAEPIDDNGYDDYLLARATGG